MGDARTRLLEEASRCKESSPKEQNLQDVVRDLFLEQLGQMFFPRGPLNGESSAWSQERVVAHFWFDFTERESFLGMYSSPTVNCGEKERVALGRACFPDSTLHFAGEHTNDSTVATVQAAMESGERAAKEIASSLWAGGGIAGKYLALF